MGNRNNASRQYAFLIITLMVIFTTTLYISGCGTSKRTGTGKIYSKTCNLPSDQANSLQGEWAKTPIKISYHSGEFSGTDKADIAAAAGVWNDFFNASKSFSIIEVGDESALNQSVPNCTAGAGADGTVLYKVASGWSHGGSAVAVTLFCTINSGGKVPKMTNAILKFNYQNYWGGTTGKTPDMQSIAVHELGHLIGLDHSCGALRSGLPNVACPDANSGNFLVDTVMYPTVFFNDSGEGEIKTDLRTNDQERANCLYE